MLKRLLGISIILLSLLACGEGTEIKPTTVVVIKEIVVTATPEPTLPPEPTATSMPAATPMPTSIPNS